MAIYRILEDVAFSNVRDRGSIVESD